MSTQQLTDAAAVTDTTTPASTHGPRFRWAAVVWGCFFLATALGALWVVTDDTRRGLAESWVGTLSPGVAIAYAGLVVGVLLLISGVAALIRKAQRG